MFFVPTVTFSELEWLMGQPDTLSMDEMHLQQPFLTAVIVMIVIVTVVALHCRALHCTTLDCTARRCTSLHYTSLYCTALNFTALYYTVIKKKVKQMYNNNKSGKKCKKVGFIVLLLLSAQVKRVSVSRMWDLKKTLPQG